jgi:hypothetical protein
MIALAHSQVHTTSDERGLAGVRRVFRSTQRMRLLILKAAVLLLSTAVCAQQMRADEEANTESLQKATQNPVASLISVPLQNNTQFWHRSV